MKTAGKGFDDEPEPVQLIDLTPPEIVRVHPRRARLAAIAIGVFTGLTCLGLATSAVASRPDRRFDPRADIAVASVRPGGPGPQATAAALVVLPIAARAVLAPGSPGSQSIVQVSGAVLGSVERVEVRLLIGGRPIDLESAPVERDGPSAGGASVDERAMGLWSAELAIPAGVTARPSDGLAVVELSWIEAGGTSGRCVLVVPLGDGRRRG